MSARRERAVRAACPGAELAPGYEVIEHLRRGNDLDVYDAWSERAAGRCVVKALRPDRLGKRRLAPPCSRGRAARALTHPHIVRAYETIAEPLPMVVLETLPGATLVGADRRRARPAGAAEIGHLGLQLGSALAYLHGNGVLHLDLKPSNVIAEAGRAKLIDLSLARPPGEAPAGIGTWHYLSPEQARGGDARRRRPTSGASARCCSRSPPARRPSTTIPTRGSTREPARHHSERAARALPPARAPGAQRPRRCGRRCSAARRARSPPASSPSPPSRPSLAQLLGRSSAWPSCRAAERRWSADRRSTQRSR